MVSKKDKEAIIILLDVGSNMKQLTDTTGTTFLQSSKDCVSQIVQRKIFSNSADEIALIVLGYAETKNCLANGNGYKNIAVFTEHLAVADWELLRIVNELDVNTNCMADWLDALVIALQYIKDESDVKCFNKYKIVLFSNFESPVSDDQIETIITALKELEINLVVIGPDVRRKEYVPGKLKSVVQTTGEVLISNIVDEVTGVICSFEEAFPELMHFQRKNVKPTPWNALFTISDKIKIPIRAFKKVAETTPMKWFSKAIDDPNAGVIKEKAYIKFDEGKGIEQEVEKHDVINAYRFGSTFVPFSDIDQETMKYASGPKGLYFIGCTSREHVPLHMLMGNGSYILLSSVNDDVAKIVLETFIDAMYEKDTVGIVRKVYTDNSTPTIGALFPVITQEFKYLVFAELPFAEDEHIYRFPSLSEIKISERQIEAIDKLIDKFDLEEKEGELERYDVTKIYDHHEQYVLRCISHKALYPDKKIYEHIKQSCKRVLQPLPEIMESCQKEVNCIKTLFPLENVEPIPKKPRFGKSKTSENDLSVQKTILFQNAGRSDSADNGNDDAVQSVAQPSIADFEEQKYVIENLVSSGSGNILKLISAIKLLRNSCFTCNTKLYNDWIQSLKTTIWEKNYFSMWNDIAKEKLGLITVAESSSSDVEIQKAEEFLKECEEVDSQYGTQDSLDDLLNEL